MERLEYGVGLLQVDMAQLFLDLGWRKKGAAVASHASDEHAIPGRVVRLLRPATQ